MQINQYPSVTNITATDKFLASRSQNDGEETVNVTGQAVMDQINSQATSLINTALPAFTAPVVITADSTTPPTNHSALWVYPEED